MEDDEGDTMAVEESASDKKEEDQESAADLHSDTNSEKCNSPSPDKSSSPIPVVGENSVKLDCEDNMKTLTNVESSSVSSDKDGQNNSGALTVDSVVPKSPKKINGEVELSKCEGTEQRSAPNYCGDNVEVEGNKSAEDDDTNSESENMENPRKRKQQLNPVSDEMKDSREDVQNSEGNVEYKGFKKRILAQTSIAANNNMASGDSPKSVLKCMKSILKKGASESQHVLVSHQTLPDGTQSSAQLTEYAQYLGLQPTVKFKCYKCGESGFPSMLKLQEHQNTCLKNFNKLQTLIKPAPPPPTSEPSPSTNFRITRKVYLCSGCGTYYENWNLFLHMREVHKRHICLFCLGMFSQADKLATHLSGKHGIIEGLYTSSEHFVNEFKGSCFLMCCTCERMFTERENFYDHSCSEGLIINTDKACSLCGLRGAHFPTCRRAFTDGSSSPPPSSSSVPATPESPSESAQNSQLAIQERSLSVTKYLIPVGKVPGKKTNQKANAMLDNVGENQEKSRDLSDIDDDYDISNAASFCHVNIHEPQEKHKPIVISKAKTLKCKNQDVVAKKVAELKPTISSPSTTKQSQNTANNTDNSDYTMSEDIQDINIELGDKIVKAKEVEESKEIIDNQSSKIPSESGKAEESICEEETKPNNSDVLSKTDVQNNCSLESSVTEELEVNIENELLQTNVTPSEPRETVAKSPPKSDISPKTSPQTETKVSSKTASATEADSESESSDSGDDTEESSSSSEASSEESDHREDIEEMKDKDKNDESDVDNADSDKMSLVVDENRSEEETDLQKEKTDVVEKQNIEDKVSESEDTKQDEPKSDIDMMHDSIEETQENKLLEDEKNDEPGDCVQLAGDDVPLLELTLEENLDTMNIQMLLKESVKVSCLNCVYCNHAKKIAVNGKQLALHLLAEHRFAPVVCSDSGELTEADGFVDKLKTSLSELQLMFFNTDSYDNMDQTCIHPYDRTYECFHCHFLTTLHKELYVHNRKMHQKTILLCIMCKSNFYSYSELLCHLCPGIYVPESNISFRCCLCTVDGLPSAFRLMVHLRKRHHACDVCLETTGDQQKLSNHVWKHKLHHLCYRCGIAYRNKPDITKHLFWKHGTESVLCKKCLQKKWPHVYHFCIPPNAFVCEECNSSFSRAVALKVHKRLHAGDLPYPCGECEEHFISRKLLTKHQEKHREPLPAQDIVETKLQENGPVGEVESHEETKEDKIKIDVESNNEEDMFTQENAAVNSTVGVEESQNCNAKVMGSKSEADVADEVVEAHATESSGETSKYEEKEVGEKKSKVVDVYDLPPLNLSSESDDSDDDDDDGERKNIQLNVKTNKSVLDTEMSVNKDTSLNGAEKISESLSHTDEDVQQAVQVVDGIWDNFKTYKANLERRESLHVEVGESSNQKAENESHLQPCDRISAEVISIINMDHDYCGPPPGTSHSIDAEEQSASVLEVKVEHKLSLQQELEKTEEPKENTDEDKKICDADHNYCYTNTTSLSVENEKEKDISATPVAVTSSPSKKKQKSPKKKQKRSASSSSSDSSSNSDSSTCSCGTNCSCSSTSSSSSGSSSSQSSDSDSSSSEGRRRQAARRERRRDRAKKRKVDEVETVPVKVDTTVATTDGPPVQDEVPPLANLVEPEEVELPIQESDLDTDETETDEDFYDKYPQRLANKLLAEKRNQLLLLAAVAPVNNGTMSQSGQSPPPSSIEEPAPKKKVKTKKHKRSQHQHNTSENKVENKLKLNIPTDYYSTQTNIFSKSSMPATSTNNSMNTTVLATSARVIQSPYLTSHTEPSTPSAAYHSTGSGSETDSKRLSKRKRVPKRFYGDSSDEEPDQPQVKWRKVIPTASNSPVPTVQTVPGFTYKSSSISVPEPVRVPAVPDPANEEKSEEEEEAAEESDSDHEDAKKSSTESSNSESEAEKEQDDDLSDAESEVETPSAMQTNTVSTAREGENEQKNENLYCYCQCPYDEVSEMIACDGKDCTIEWFHFECVGIMVPPKGKWFCPDCRKRAAARSEYLLHV